MVDPINPNPSGELPPGGNNDASKASDVVITSADAPPSAQRALIVTIQSVTPRPNTANATGKYMPSFPMPMYGGDK